MEVQESHSNGHIWRTLYWNSICPCIYPSLYSSIDLSIHLAIHLSINISSHLSIYVTEYFLTPIALAAILFLSLCWKACDPCSLRISLRKLVNGRTSQTLTWRQAPLLQYESSQWILKREKAFITHYYLKFARVGATNDTSLLIRIQTGEIKITLLVQETRL